MNEAEFDTEQADEEALVRDVSDEALEALSAGAAGGVSTLMYGSYCFTCTADR